MPGLNASLSIAVQALQVQQGALQASANNVANVNTPGYSRQEAVLAAVPPPNGWTQGAGGGVTIQQYQSIRDQVLELQIQEETAQQNSADTQTNAAQLIEPLYTTSGQDIGSEMSAYFNSISALSASPSDTTLRQGVMQAGQNLAYAFQSTASGLDQIQTSMDQTVTQDVSQINQLTQQIATVNGQIGAANGGMNSGALVDQLNTLVGKLSALTGVSVIQTEQGITLTTANGLPLVVGGQSFALSTATGSDGMQHVMAQGQDITSTISGGSLGGAIQMRDQVIPGLLNQLDTLASTFATSVNSVSLGGSDLNGAAGADFFSLPDTPTWNSGSVASATTALTAGTFTLQSPSGTSTAIAVGGSSGINDLSDLASYINGQSLGVTATVVNDSNGAHLSISGNASTRFSITSDSTALGFYSSGVALQLGLAFSDVSKIAASSDGTPGSNGNLTSWMALQNKLYSGQGATTSYSNMVAQVGTISANAQAQSDAAAQTLQLLNDQRSSISGVSIDEETTNMLKYQQAYEASARVVTTIDQLMSVVLNMDTGNMSY